MSERDPLNIYCNGTENLQYFLENLPGESMFEKIPIPE